MTVSVVGRIVNSLFYDVNHNPRGTVRLDLRPVRADDITKAHELRERLTPPNERVTYIDFSPYITFTRNQRPCTEHPYFFVSSILTAFLPCSYFSC